MLCWFDLYLRSLQYLIKLSPGEDERLLLLLLQLLLLLLLACPRPPPGLRHRDAPDVVLGHDHGGGGAAVTAVKLGLVAPDNLNCATFASRK